MNRWQVAGFMVLCLWSSAGWITSTLLPPAMPALAGQALHFGLIGVLGLLFCAAGRSALAGTVQVRWGVTVAGVGLFAVPFLLLHEAEGMVSLSLGVVVFALTPVVVLGVTAFLGDSTGGGMRLLPAALAGLAGILLLLPVQLPQSARSALGLGLMLLAMASTALCLVVLHRFARHMAVAWVVVQVCGASGAVLAGAAMLAGPGGWDWQAFGKEMVRCLLLDVPEILLLIWLIRGVAPHRVAARFLVAPLFTVLEGVLVVRQEFGTRMGAGVALLVVGSYLVLRPDEAAETVGLGPR